MKYSRMKKYWNEDYRHSLIWSLHYLPRDTVYNYMITYNFLHFLPHTGPLSYSVHTVEGGYLMSNHSIYILLIFQCVALYLIYGTLFKLHSHRTIQFFVGVLQVLIPIVAECSTSTIFTTPLPNEEVVLYPFYRWGAEANKVQGKRTNLRCSTGDALDLVFQSTQHYVALYMFKAELSLTSFAATAAQHFSKWFPWVLSQPVCTINDHVCKVWFFFFF